MAKRKTTRNDKIQDGRQRTPRYQKTVEVVPKTQAQDHYIKAINSFTTTIGIGSAGTGKSYIPLAMAARDFVVGDCKQIIILRPLVAVAGKELGYMKGDLEEKMAPWAAAPVENLKKILGKPKVEYMIRHEEIMARPLGYERGVTYDDAFVILDEAQNATESELEMFLTRIGENCRVVITGDHRQSDLAGEGWLEPLVDMCEDQDLPVGVVYFDSDDGVRSDACTMWVKAFEKNRPEDG